MNYPVPDDFPEDEFFFYPEFCPPDRPEPPPSKMPWSREAERAVVSAMLQWPADVVPEVVGHGASSLFSRESHGVIFSTLVDLLSSSRPVDLVTITDELRHRDSLARIGGAAELAALLDEVSSPENLLSWLEVLRDFAVRRDLLALCLDTRQAVLNGDDVYQLLDQVEKRIYDIRSKIDQVECAGIRETVLTAMERIDRSFSGGPAISGRATGFQALDAMTDGLHPGELAVICGAPGVGKTIFATNLVEAMALDSDGPVAVGWFALQDFVGQTVERLIVSRAGFNLHDVHSGALTNRDDIEKVKQAASEVAETTIHIEERERSILELRNQVRRWKRQSDIQLLVVDYLQLLKGDRNLAWSCYEVELAEITAGLKGLARELEIPVVAFASVASAVGELDGNPPRLGQLSSVWPVLQDADLVGCLWDCREPNRPEGKYRELHVLKQRNGPLGKVGFRFIPGRLRFVESFRDPANADGGIGSRDEECPATPGESVVVSESGIFPS